MALSAKAVVGARASPSGNGKVGGVELPAVPRIVPSPTPSPFPAAFGSAFLPLSPLPLPSRISFAQRWLRGQKTGVGVRGLGWRVEVGRVLGKKASLTLPLHFSYGTEGKRLHSLTHPTSPGVSKKDACFPGVRGSFTCCPACSNSGYTV